MASIAQVLQGHLQPAESVLLGESLYQAWVPLLHFCYVHLTARCVSVACCWACDAYPHAGHAYPYAIAPISALLNQHQAAIPCSISCTC